MVRRQGRAIAFGVLGIYIIFEGAWSSCWTGRTTAKYHASAIIVPRIATPIIKNMRFFNASGCCASGWYILTCSTVISAMLLVLLTRQALSSGFLVSQGVILGCTEIPFLVQQSDVKVPVFDTTMIHAEASVDYALNRT